MLEINSVYGRASCCLLRLRCGGRNIGLGLAPGARLRGHLANVREQLIAVQTKSVEELCCGVDLRDDGGPLARADDDQAAQPVLQSPGHEPGLEDDAPRTPVQSRA